MLEVAVDEADVGRCDAEAICASDRAVSVRPKADNVSVEAHSIHLANPTFSIRRMLVHLPSKLRDFCPVAVA